MRSFIFTIRLTIPTILLSYFVACIHASPVTLETIEQQHVKRQCNRGYCFADDQDAKLPINYEGTWVHLRNQGSSVQRGTLSYTGQANA